MDLRSLQYFVTVAEELNITRAAAVLQMSQPPLSNRIKQLEQELNTSLFIRRKRGLQLTSTGKILYKRARQILELTEYTVQEVANYENELSGNLKVGTVGGRAPYLLSRWIAGFRDEFPLVNYTLRSGSSDEILEMLYGHLIDIAIIAAPYNPEILNGFSVGRTPWVATIPGDHPLAKKEGREISLEDLKDESLIAPVRTSRIKAIEEWFGEKGMTPKVICKCSNYMNVIALVEQNVGISIFPQTTYTPNPHTVVKLIVDTPKYADYVLVYTKDHSLSELAETFRDYVKDFLEANRIQSARFQIREEEFLIPPDATFL